MQDFLAGCNGLSRGFAVNDTGNPVFESYCPVELPAASGELLQAEDTFPVCQGKDIDYSFVNKVVDGQSVQQTEAFPVGYFRRVDERGVFPVLLTNQIQHGISGKQREGTPLVPEWETLPLRPDPLQQFLVLVWKITVQCHNRYDLYCRHTSIYLFTQNKSVKLTHYQVEALASPL